MRRWAALLGLESLWSVTTFRDQELVAYAERVVLSEVRRGVASMAGLSAVLQMLVGVLHLKLGEGGIHLYMYGLVVVLAVHVMLAARAARSLRALYALGMTLLAVLSMALVLLAHRTGTVSGPLLASVVLLFMVVPIVPWGLKHCLAAMVLLYGTFTLSTYGVAERFPPESLITMQFMMFAAALTTIAMVARSVQVRRDDIEARYRLEQAHRELHLLSQQDPLTGAWNRRFLEENFDRLIAEFLTRPGRVYFALLDVDDFKATNDRHGHHHGDAVLRLLVDALRISIGDAGQVVRLGGDEFAVLYCGEDFADALAEAFADLHSRRQMDAKDSIGPVSASAGVVQVTVGGQLGLDAVYRLADEALYVEKLRRRHGLEAEPDAAPAMLERSA